MFTCIDVSGAYQKLLFTLSIESVSTAYNLFAIIHSLLFYRKTVSEEKHQVKHFMNGKKLLAYSQISTTSSNNVAKMNLEKLIKMMNKFNSGLHSELIEHIRFLKIIYA